MKPVSRRTRNARLLKLADLLVADAGKKKGIKFDLSFWGYVENQEEPLSCGTQACAAGLAAISGAFKRQGLSYEIVGTSRIELTLDGYYPDLHHRFNKSFLVARDFFGLTDRQAEFLFTPNDYPDHICAEAASERFVAKRIRNFVATGEIRQ